MLTTILLALSLHIGDSLSQKHADSTRFDPSCYIDERHTVRFEHYFNRHDPKSKLEKWDYDDEARFAGYYFGPNNRFPFTTGLLEWYSVCTKSAHSVIAPKLETIIIDGDYYTNNGIGTS